MSYLNKALPLLSQLITESSTQPNLYPTPLTNITSYDSVSAPPTGRAPYRHKRTCQTRQKGRCRIDRKGGVEEGTKSIVDGGYETHGKYTINNYHPCCHTYQRRSLSSESFGTSTPPSPSSRQSKQASCHSRTTTYKPIHRQARYRSGRIPYMCTICNTKRAGAIDGEDYER